MLPEKEPEQGASSHTSNASPRACTPPPPVLDNGPCGEECECRGSLSGAKTPPFNNASLLNTSYFSKDIWTTLGPATDINEVISLLNEQKMMGASPASWKLLAWQGQMIGGSLKLAAATRLPKMCASQEPQQVVVEQPCNSTVKSSLCPPKVDIPTISASTSAPLHPQSYGQKPVARQPQHSIGSLGHPHTCAPACRYVKRQGSCRDGVLCPNCHLCFWQRKAADPQPEPKLAASQPLIASNVQPSKLLDADNQHVKELVQVQKVTSIKLVHTNNSDCNAVISRGTEGHPHSCNKACKYVRRKTGCREGASCPNCHACQWQRGLPAERGLVANREEPTGPGLTHATERLAKLIRLQLLCRERELIRNSVQEQTTAPDHDAPVVHPEDMAATPATNDPVSSACEKNTTNAATIVPELGTDCPSIGSMNHPGACGLACKYHNKTSGCKDGLLCMRCHLCRWQRKQGVPAAESPKPIEVVSTSEAKVSNKHRTEEDIATNAFASPSCETSVGSIGHPYDCHPACKYVKRKGGCRDGWQCLNCHICQWTRKPMPKTLLVGSNTDVRCHVPSNH